MLNKSCNQCNKTIFKNSHHSKVMWENTKYCSKACSIKNTGFGTKDAWNKGLKGYMAGELNNKWKGDDVGYFALHAWMKRNYGKPLKCEDCGADDKDKTYEWANISHEYKRDRSDWKPLCKKCHCAFDSGTKKRGTEVSNSKLNVQKVKLIKMMHRDFNWTGKRIWRHLGKAWGVSDTNIYYILNGKAWAHVN